LAISPDGQSLYSGTGVWCQGMDNVYCLPSAAVTDFRRDSATGALDFRECLTGTTNSDCTPIRHANYWAFANGLGDVTSVAASPDGMSLYAASSKAIFASTDAGSQTYGGNALARFARDPATGALTYVDCITADQRSGPSGSGACSEVSSATADGSNSGLDGLQSVALSPDGKSLYASADGYLGNDSIARFDRDPTSGALTYRGCITGSKQLGPSGSGACRQIPSATQDGSGSGLDGPGPIVVSDDGRSLYAVASGDIVQFDRNPNTGAIRYRGCLTGNPRLGSSGSGVCAQIPTAGQFSGLGGPRSIALGDKGKSLYLGSGDSIARFDRDPHTGAITFAGCVTGDTRAGPSGSGACRLIPSATKRGLGSGLDPSFIAIGAGGGALYAGGGEAVTGFRLSPANGALRYEGCLTGAKRDSACGPIPTATTTGRDSGLDRISALAASGKSLYAASGPCRSCEGDIARFALAPQTRVTGGPNGTTQRHRAVFRFRADTPSKFACKLSGPHVKPKLRHWRRCGSHAFRHKGRGMYRHLQSGGKVFKVRATDRTHATDPTPAKRRWRIR
jgi:hypothetical protein